MPAKFCRTPTLTFKPITMTQNTFKPTTKPAPPVIITEKEMAVYNYVKLKLAHEKQTVEQIAHNILQTKYAKQERRLSRVGKGIIVTVAASVIGIILHHLI